MKTHRRYSPKDCQICKKEYLPTGPNQKACLNCSHFLHNKRMQRYRSKNPQRSLEDTVFLRLHYKNMCRFSDLKEPNEEYIIDTAVENALFSIFSESVLNYSSLMSLNEQILQEMKEPYTLFGDEILPNNTVSKILSRFAQKGIIDRFRDFIVLKDSSTNSTTTIDFFNYKEEVSTDHFCDAHFDKYICACEELVDKGFISLDDEELVSGLLLCARMCIWANHFDLHFDAYLQALMRRNYTYAEETLLFLIRYTDWINHFISPPNIRYDISSSFSEFIIFFYSIGVINSEDDIQTLLQDLHSFLDQLILDMSKYEENLNWEEGLEESYVEYLYPFTESFIQWWMVNHRKQFKSSERIRRIFKVLNLYSPIRDCYLSLERCESARDQLSQVLDHKYVAVHIMKSLRDMIYYYKFETL